MSNVSSNVPEFVYFAADLQKDALASVGQSQQLLVNF
jgi:hypothetical protein